LWYSDKLIKGVQEIKKIADSTSAASKPNLYFSNVLINKNIKYESNDLKLSNTKDLTLSKENAIRGASLHFGILNK